MADTHDLPQLSPAYMENSRWLLEHSSELQRDYANQWVAIHDGKVVAADPELGVVSAAAARVAPPEDTVVYFADDGSMIFFP